MNAAWWLDITLSGLLLLLALVGYKLHRYGGQPLDVVTDPAEPDASGLAWYPRRLIRQAGILPPQLVMIYWLSKLLLALLLPLLLVELTAGRLSMIWLSLPALAGLFAIDIWLWRRRRERRRKISASLGFLLELMVVYLNAGLNLVQAFQQAAYYGLTRDHPLAKEVLLVARELAAGRERHQAFAALADRTGVNDLRRLAAVMTVGSRVGAPIAQTLSVQAELLRTRQVQYNTEEVNRKNMTALLPMMLVSLPMFAVLVLFPAGIQIHEVLQMMKYLF